MKRRTKEDILTAIYIGALVMVNLLGSKIMTVAGIRMNVGIVCVPIMFLVTDIMSEVNGRGAARRLVYISMGVLLAMLAFIAFAIAAPPHPSWGNQEAYRSIFSQSLRMTFASVVAFGISQNIDISAFEFWKKCTKGRYLWIRNNLSTMLSQFIDSALFMYLAFWHIAPKFTTAFVFSLVIPLWLIKVLLALLDTPLCYVGVRWLQAGEEA